MDAEGTELPPPNTNPAVNVPPFGEIVAPLSNVYWFDDTWFMFQELDIVSFNDEINKQCP